MAAGALPESLQDESNAWALADAARNGCSNCNSQDSGPLFPNGDASQSQNPEIKVAQVLLYGGAKEDSPIIAKGNVAPFDYADNPVNYLLDVNQGGVDPESSVFSIGVTFRSSKTRGWVPDSLKIDVPSSGRWKLTDIADIPAIRKDQSTDRFSVILNLRAADLNAPNKAIKLQVSAFYSSLYRQDQRPGIEHGTITGKAYIKLLIGKSTVREVP